MYKVYTFWNKYSKPEVGLFPMSISFGYWNEELRRIFPGLKDKKYTISWKDEEGDDLIISSMEDLRVAHIELNRIFSDSIIQMKLYINVEDPQFGKDSAMLKVFTLWHKVSKPEVRFFFMTDMKFSSLHNKLQISYPGLKGNKYTISWKDKNGDDIMISSDEDLLIARLCSDVRTGSFKAEINLNIIVENPEIGKQDHNCFAAPKHSDNDGYDVNTSSDQEI